ncbi:MAG TPA: histidine kinase [Spirochaetia bacterium]
MRRIDPVGLLHHARDLFGSLSIRTRILIFVIVVSNVSVLVIGIVSYRLAFDTIRTRAEQFTHQIIENVTEKVDELLQGAQDACTMVADDPSIQAVLRAPLEADLGRRYSRDLEVDTQLNFIQSYRPGIFGIYIIGANGSSYKSSFYSLKRSDMREEQWYRRVAAGKEPVWFGFHDGSFATVTLEQPMVTVGLPIMDRAGRGSLGVVIADVEVDQLLRIIRSKIGNTGFIFIADGERNVISNPDIRSGSERETALRSVMEAFGPSRPSAESATSTKEFLSFSDPSAVTGWTITGVMPRAELVKDTWSIRRTITILIPVICLLDILAAWYLAGVLAHPIKKLTRLMRRVEGGDFTVVMDARTTDEIGLLAQGFNVMVARIRELMESIHTEHRKLRAAELAALQAQINPHFLYNTLESITWLSRAGRSADVIHIVKAMTSLFRIGISGGREMITVRDELEHVRSYLTIQQIRYKDKLDYTIDVPDSIGDCRILKLVLQPLVENAIYHGIKSVRGKGRIEVRGRQENGDIVLEVADTGIGMRPDALAALQASLRDGTAEEASGGSYGLKNVQERLVVSFGQGYGLSFESELGRGTTVSVRVPRSFDGGGES